MLPVIVVLSGSRLPGSSQNQVTKFTFITSVVSLSDLAIGAQLCGTTDVEANHSSMKMRFRHLRILT